jgi:hypothetical protein
MLPSAWAVKTKAHRRLEEVLVLIMLDLAGQLLLQIRFHITLPCLSAVFVKVIRSVRGHPVSKPRLPLVAAPA